MDWDRVIERNSERLFAVVATLVSMVRVHGGGVAVFLPRYIYSAALTLLLPAESAVRRLIVIAARGLVLKPRAGRAFPAGLALNTGAEPVPAFCLTDPLKRFAAQDFEWRKVRVLPRISVPGLFDPVFIHKPVSSEDDLIAAGALHRRLRALKQALETLPRQARRLARWKAKRELERQSGVRPKPVRLSPFRPGFAPGYRRSRPQEVDEILADCHYFAVEAWNGADTS
jgi:hypothetical protein